jgi:predicted aspartyl protease
VALFLKDEVKEEQNRSLADKLTDVLGTAAAVSTTAAFLYRGIGGRNLSKLFDTGASSFRVITDEISSTRYKDYSLKRLREMSAKIKQDIKTERAKINAGIAEPRVNAKDSLAEKLGHMYQLLKAPDVFKRRLYNDLYLITPALENSKKLLDSVNATQAERRELEAAIRRLPYVINDKNHAEEKIQQIRDSIKIKDSQRTDIIKQALDLSVNVMRNQMSGKTTSFRAVSGKLDNAIEQIKSELFNLDTLSKEQNKGSIIDKALDDNRAKVRDILSKKNKDKVRLGTSSYLDAQGEPVYYDRRVALEEIQKYILDNKPEDYEKFLNLSIDSYLRKDANGEIYSFSRTAGLFDKAMQIASNTLPGKILKLQDIRQTKLSSSVVYVPSGSVDPLLSGAVEGQLDRTRQSYVRIYNKTFSINQAGELTHEEQFDNATLMSGRYGGLGKQIRKMSGLEGERQTDSWIRNFFDINKTNELNYFERIGSIFTKNRDTDYIPNVLKAIKEGSLDSIQSLFEMTSQVEMLMQASVKPLSLSQVRRLAEQEANNADLALLNAIKSNDLTSTVEELLGYAQHTDNAFQNTGLIDLLKSYSKDSAAALQRVTTRRNTNPNYYSTLNNSIGFEEELKTELSKEYFLRKVIHGGDVESTAFTELKNLLEQSDIGDVYEAKRTGYAAILQYMSGISKKEYSTSTIENQVREAEALYIRSILRGETQDEGKQDLKKIIEQTVSDVYGKFDMSEKLPDNSFADAALNNFVHVKNMITPLDVIRDLNDNARNGKETAFKFVEQFFAGRDNPEAVTSLTFYPYFMLSRLGDDLNNLGLGFSNDSTKNFLSLAKTIGLKRILPVAVGATYLEFTDDTAQALFGTGIAATAVNGAANVDLFARKVADFTGIQSFLDNQFDLNPALQYWGGKDGFYTYDEEKDYYENGYTPVRKGRYWWFGSSNEVRGGQIQYWTPNLVRKLNSDYYDKSMYDGYFDKWSHSLLPTPINPISPLLYLADPYWLENKHYNDRPYAVSGPMFAEETPWGIALNSTIGQIIKPVKEMHKDRLYDGVDVKAMAYAMNERIREKAIENSGGYRASFDDDGSISSIRNIAYNAPDLETRLINISSSGDGRTVNIDIGGDYGSGYGQRLISINNRPDFSKNEGYSGYGSRNIGEIGIGYGYGDGSDGSVGSNIGLSLIADENRSIRVQASQNANNSVQLNERLSYTKSIAADKIDQGEDVEKLINQARITSLSGIAEESAVSARLITGIYGYGANRFFGFGEENTKIIANASDMTSFSRSFWDMSIGGVGGGAMEIYRRFIPEYRRNRRVSPLMNEMPDWLPLRYRFGDPYTAVPDGEARMPGEGYESLNNLHPDAYGAYGAFDRYKILADIAPYSKEFKTWKAIAKATIQDERLVKEMDAIQKRADEQSKTHDFYNYRFLGQDVDYQNAIIKNVYANGAFTVFGSDEVYKLAGVDFTDDNFVAQSKNILKQYINSGMSVTLAVDSNPYTRTSDDYKKSVNAAVFVDGENVSQTLLDEGFVEKRKDNLNAADIAAMHGTFGIMEGTALELLTHVDLPLISDRWLRIRSPLESYKAEQIYGTPYQTWSDITGTFVMPAIERAISDGSYSALSTMSFIGMNMLHDKQGIGKTSKIMLSAAMSLTNRGAFIGGAISYAINANGRGFATGQKIGAAAMLAGSLYSSVRGDSLADNIMSWGTAGLLVGDFLDETKAAIKDNDSLTKKALRSFESVEFRGKAALIGVAAGLASYGLSALGGDRGPWIPDRVKEKWETEEYFDRLKYVKYMGMYNKAKELAKSEDDIDLDEIINYRKSQQALENQIREESDANAPWYYKLKHQISNAIHKNVDMPSDHRFEYDDGFSIEDLPGVHNGVFDSTNITPEERLYTLNALATQGIKHSSKYSENEERDMTKVKDFLDLHKTEQLDGYEVHHVVPFSMNGSDDPSNMIMLSHEDHAWITNEHKKYFYGENANATLSESVLEQADFLDQRGKAVTSSAHVREALLYLQTAEETMYSVAERKESDWIDIIKALPAYEKDYYKEFKDEKDPSRREEILKYASPFQKRALLQTWKQFDDTDDLESNESYFGHNNLPNPFWEGWKNDVDLNDVKAKMVKNEGQLFSDFNIYESEYRKPEVINAPFLKRKDSSNAIAVKARLESALSGLGLSESDVSVQPSSTSGVQAVINIMTVSSYNLKESIRSLF